MKNNNKKMIDLFSATIFVLGCAVPVSCSLVKLKRSPNSHVVRGSAVCLLASARQRDLPMAASSGHLLSEPGGAGSSALGSNWLQWGPKQGSREMHDLLS